MAIFDNKQELQQLCHLYLCGQVSAARRLIEQKAQITPEERAGIPQGKTGDFILRNRADSDLHKMVAVERTFYYSGQVLNADIETDSDDALFAAERLGEIVSYAYPQEQIYLKSRQAECYRYSDITDDEQDNQVRYRLYRDVMENYPVSEEKQDEFLMKWAKEIKDLKISSIDKYESLKSAQLRSSDYGRYAYKQDLKKLSEFYFSFNLDKVKEKGVPAEDKILAAQKAKKAIDDIDVDDVVVRKYQNDPLKLQELRDYKKHKYMLAALNGLKNAYKECGRVSDVKAVNLQIGKAQNTFYKKYPQYRRRGPGYGFSR